MAPKRFLTVREVAELLGVCPETVRAQVRNGALKAINVGGSWRFSAQYIGHEAERRGRTLCARKRLLTVKEVADLMRVHPETIRGYVRRHILSATYVGNKWLCKPSDIERFLERRTQEDHGADARKQLGMGF